MNDKEVVFADNFFVAGSLNSIKDYWDKSTAISPKYDYFRKSTKSYLIVKESKLMEGQKLFAHSRVNIDGKRQLGEVIRSTEYRDEHLKDLVKDWDKQLTILSTNAEKKRQAALFSICLWVYKQT